MLNSRQRMEMTLNRAVAKQSKQNVVTPPRSDPQTGEIHERQRKEREREPGTSAGGRQEGKRLNGRHCDRSGMGRGTIQRWRGRRLADVGRKCVHACLVFPPATPCSTVLKEVLNTGAHKGKGTYLEACHSMLEEQSTCVLKD